MMATAAAVAFVVISCKGKLGEAAALDLSETPVQTVRDMFIVQTENSGLQMRAEAPLMEKYENPIEHTCDIKEGDVFIANGWEKPDGICDSAWESMSAFVMTLSHGGGNFYNGWMKNEKSAMISCNDGFRPVSFYLETLEEDSE